MISVLANIIYEDLWKFIAFKFKVNLIMTQGQSTLYVTIWDQLISKDSLTEPFIASEVDEQNEVHRSKPMGIIWVQISNHSIIRS